MSMPPCQPWMRSQVKTLARAAESFRMGGMQVIDKQMQARLRRMHDLEERRALREATREEWEK